jgi:hypothetical protein
MAKTETETDSVTQKQSFALKQWQFYLLTGISAAALGLVFVTTSLSANIGGMRTQIDERQKFINETLLLSRLNVQLAQVLANLAVATNDNELKQVLYVNGITFSTDTPSGTNKAALTPGSTYGPSSTDGDGASGAAGAGR